ncbi:tetratricopeptide repeat-containing sensor histidine kinase [Mucilaginibacter jinjuensis]|uniref:histidine kinase n=1 Tax=Mucilaginibacter jinjuensis TaxID=1176721 RepID=A0ABY7TEP1_9SPHI|nr:ATP-binding protein [Mucilaginibacter jinjuensis]WCT14999.1 ATP-binding protein [Mucilaginibacter jinjuensis]
MGYNKTYNIFFSKYSPALLLGFISILFFISCKQQGYERDYSAGFSKLLDTANRQSYKDPEGAVKFLDSAFRHLNNVTINDKFRRLGFHYVLAMRIKHNNKEGLLYADSMLDVINKDGGQQKNPSLFSEANFAKADAYFNMHDYANAYPCYFTGYQIGKNHLDKLVLTAYSYRMGMITYQQSHYNLAINYFKDSYKQSLPLDTDFVIFYRNQEILDNIGLAYRHLNKPDSALAYFQKSIDYVNLKGGNYTKIKPNLMEIAKAVVYGNQADIYIKQRQYPKATELLKKSIAVTIQKNNDNYDALLSEIKLAKIYADEKQDALMLPLLDSIHTQLKVIDNKQAESDWNSLMSDYYARKSQPVLALSYNKRYNTLKDSLIESTRLLKETNVNDQLNNYEKEREIINLTNNNKLQRIYLSVAILFVAMALIIILLIFGNWRRSKNELNTVNTLNEKVNQQKINLEKALERLHESNQEKDRILHTVAHDLRNPLGGISSLTNMMISDDDLTEELRDYINIIKETADNSLELINEIFEATDSTIADSKMQLVDINTLLNNSIELLRFKAAEKNQTIELTALDSPEILLISREKIWRVISNLIINAIKFSPVGATIKVNVVRNDKTICIEVSDNGIGIPEANKAKVFNMFTEAKRPGTMGEKSFGLGLSICKQIVEKHDGKIWFDSGDSGTTFYMELNRTEETPASTSLSS